MACAGIGLAFCSPPAGPSSFDSPARAPTICAMVAEPREFQDKKVTMNAAVTSDGMHFTLLMDLAPACERGIVLNWDDKARPPETDRILDAIWRPWPGTSNKTIRGRFTGTLRHEERRDGLFPYMFVVSRVEDLEITIGERPW
jgi:hypothetical protein